METGNIYLYEYGSGIYNIDGMTQKFRLNPKAQIKFDASEIYANKNGKIPRCKRGLSFLYLKGYPHVPISFPDGKYFKSFNAANKYYKENKNQIIPLYGKFGEDFFIEGICFSYNDPRAI